MTRATLTGTDTLVKFFETIPPFGTAKPEPPIDTDEDEDEDDEDRCNDCGDDFEDHYICVSCHERICNYDVIWLYDDDTACTMCAEYCEESDFHFVGDCPGEFCEHAAIVIDGVTYPTLRGGRGKIGHLVEAPWEHDGDLLRFDAEDDEHSNDIYGAPQPLWNFDPQGNDPVRAMADYYLLSAIVHNQMNPTPHPREDAALFGIWLEADQLFRTLIDRWDPLFRAYCDFAVGGELRHHRAIGGRILPGPQTRTAAWAGWKKLRDHYGPDALLAAAYLFKDMAGDGGFGGDLWASAARVLHARITNKITPEVFIDRVFDLEHNGGVFINKVRWATKDLSPMQSKLGPAHAENPPDWHMMLVHASESARSLVYEYWPVSNRARRSAGRPFTPRPDFTNASTPRALLRWLTSRGFSPQSADRVRTLDWLRENSKKLRVVEHGDTDPVTLWLVDRYNHYLQQLHPYNVVAGWAFRFPDDDDFDVDGYLHAVVGSLDYLPLDPDEPDSVVHCDFLAEAEFRLHHALTREGAERRIALRDFAEHTSNNWAHAKTVFQRDWRDWGDFRTTVTHAGGRLIAWIDSVQNEELDAVTEADIAEFFISESDARHQTEGTEVLLRDKTSGQMISHTTADSKFYTAASVTTTETL